MPLRRCVWAISLSVFDLLACRAAGALVVTDDASTAADAGRDAPSDGRADTESDAPSPFPIEATYAEDGPWAVGLCSVFSGAASCQPSSALGDGSMGETFDLAYPANLGAGGLRHPILTWGNGTSATPNQYGTLLRHLASWGFVVVASTSPNTGTGDEMLAGEDYLVGANADATSPFYGHLDLNHIGAFGHSQGADGAAQTLIRANAPDSTHRPIQTLVPIELPAQMWTCFGMEDASCDARESFDSNSLASGSVFFIDGSKDTLISPPTQSATTSGEQSIEAYYDATPATTPKAKATLLGADHNDIQDSCVPGLFCAGLGPHRYLGYVTAWLMYTLQNDGVARRAFAGDAPEIDRETGNWEDQAQQNLR
jgi:hypothetical protein